MHGEVSRQDVMKVFDQVKTIDPELWIYQREIKNKKEPVWILFKVNKDKSIHPVTKIWLPSKDIYNILNKIWIYAHHRKENSSKDLDGETLL